jgi:hypothetical protein
MIIEPCSILPTRVVVAGVVEGTDMQAASRPAVCDDLILLPFGRKSVTRAACVVPLSLTGLSGVA